MTINSKIEFLKKRHGYKPADLVEYAAVENLQFNVAIDKLFYHHVTMEEKQGSLFDSKVQDIDTATAQEVDGRLF